MNIRNIQRHLLDGVVSRFPGLGLDKRAESMVQVFENDLPQKSQILDVGGGWGFYAAPLAERGHQLTILDVVKPGIQKAPVILYGGERFPFEDKSFDVSILVTVLHHVPFPEKVIEEVRRVTRHAVILVEDLYHHSLGRWWTVLRDQLFNFEFFGHPCNFKKREEWLSLFESSGFSLKSEKKIYTWLAGLRILNGVFIFKLNPST
ncbi:MAG: methyltransferase domain-containing protein [Candidatus Omnitrophica bacterium]|nr:methyltransferase domain-containing protein [Candidatus Omnitrophota bacterium]